MLEQLSKPRTQHTLKCVLKALPENLEEVCFGRATAPKLICPRGDLDGADIRHGSSRNWYLIIRIHRLIGVRVHQGCSEQPSQVVGQ